VSVATAFHTTTKAVALRRKNKNGENYGLKP